MERRNEEKVLNLSEELKRTLKKMAIFYDVSFDEVLKRYEELKIKDEFIEKIFITTWEEYVKQHSVTPEEFLNKVIKEIETINK